MFARKIRARAAARETAVHSLYAAAVAQARLPAFYTPPGVPDTVDGRFDLIALHVWMLVRRLRAGTGEADRRSAALAQGLFDLFMADMDRNLREMGAGDLGVGRRVKVMAKGFLGRATAYDEALAADGDGPLEAALARNLFGAATGDGGPSPSPATLGALAAYVREALGALDARHPEAMLSANGDPGATGFPPPPGGERS